MYSQCPLLIILHQTQSVDPVLEVFASALSF